MDGKGRSGVVQSPSLTGLVPRNCPESNDPDNPDFMSERSDKEWFVVGPSWAQRLGDLSGAFKGAAQALRGDHRVHGAPPLHGGICRGAEGSSVAAVPESFSEVSFFELCKAVKQSRKGSGHSWEISRKTGAGDSERWGASREPLKAGRLKLPADRGRERERDLRGT